MTAPTPIDESSPNLTSRNPAVQRCCAARQRSLQESKAKKADLYDTKLHANDAYCEAMPDLSGYENVRDFIACVAHGMLIRAIDAIQGPKFLYAAQVALGALRHEPTSQKLPAPCTPPPPLPGGNQTIAQQ